jgi:hypothetical protein
MAVAGHHDVGGFQVAMDDARLVRPRERLGDFDRKLDAARWRDRPALEQRTERLAAHQLHHDERQVVDVRDVVDDGDVRVFKCGGGARFLHESGAAHRIGDKRRRQHLDGDIAIKARVAGAIDLAHSSNADCLDNLVRSQPPARYKMGRNNRNPDADTSKGRRRDSGPFEHVPGLVVCRQQRFNLLPRCFVADCCGQKARALLSSKCGGVSD